MATKRKGMGNAKRFRIFERDGFRCQYCGRVPPAVVLHVDHIVPVAEGGADDEENLVTSCSDCNHGKHARVIDQSAVPRDYAAMAENAEARAEQLAAYREHLKALNAEIEQSIDFVGSAFWGPDTTWDYEKSEKRRRSVEMFIKMLGLGEVSDAAKAARFKIESDENISGRWRYFCGICWKKARDAGLLPPRDDE